MPGSSGPIRPRKLFSLSRDRLRLSNGSGLDGFFHGLVFSFAGLSCLACMVGAILASFGLVVIPNFTPGAPFWTQILLFLFLLVFGAGLLACGTGLLRTLRTTFDRDRDRVVVRSGWMGLHCQRRRLSEFRSVTIFAPDTGWVSPLDDESCYDIALEEENGNYLVVGYVSAKLANAVRDEISQFTGLSSAR